jgi:L-threonylcarbamoyladenylate synthase
MALTLTVAEAAAALARGEVVAFPTDTVYGLAVRPGAEERVYAIKDRPRGLPLILMAASIEELERFAMFDERARELAGRWWPGPLTLVLPAVEDGTLGVRIPDHPTAIDLLRAAGPVLTTSANRHGEPDALTADAAGRLAGLAGVIDGGPVPGGTPSTVLSLASAEPEVLREGAVPTRELLP